MTGMFSTPCCMTCEHSAVGGTIEQRTWQCLLHGKQLPVWHHKWKEAYCICQTFRYRKSTNPPDVSFMRIKYPDAESLYCFASEYSSAAILEVVKFSELPPI